MSPEQERNPAVAADMSRIFGATAATRTPRGVSGTRAHRLAPAAGAKRRSGSARRASVVVAAILAFFAGAWALTREFAGPDPSTRRPAAGPVAERRAIPQVPDPETVATPLAEGAAPADPVVIARADEPLSAGPEPETATAESTTRSRTPPPPRAAAPRPSPRSTNSAARPTVALASRPRVERGETRPARVLGIECPPGSTDDRCIYRDVLDAHRRLDDTYDRARQAGLDYRELRDVRRAWDRARAISLDEPDETIRRYDELNARLARSTRAARQEGARDPEE